MNNQFIWSGLVILATAFQGADGYAAEDKKNDTVVDRQRDELKPLGINFRSFVISPQMGLAPAYNSNIYKQDSRVAEITDFIFHFSPGVKVGSNWTRHALNFNFSSDLAEYVSHRLENFQDINLSTDGRIDILRNSNISVAHKFSHLHEDRGSPEQIVAANPTFYDVNDMKISNLLTFNRLSSLLGFDAKRYDYDDQTRSDGTVNNNQDRNRWQYEASLRLGYDVIPQYQTFLDLKYVDVSYDNKIDDNGFNRSSHGYEGLAGLKIELTNLLIGEFGVGYKHREYNDDKLSNVNGLVGFADLTWNPTLLTTVSPRISRDINETTQNGVAGILKTSFDIDITHELKRNIILRAGGGYSFSDYQGFNPAIATADRVDNVYTGQFGVKYMLSRYVYTDLTYTYTSRSASNADLANYDQHLVMFSIVGQI